MVRGLPSSLNYSEVSAETEKVKQICITTRSTRKNLNEVHSQSSGSAVGIATGYWPNNRGFRVSSPGKGEEFSLLQISIPVLKPFAHGYSDRGVKLTPYFQIVSRSRKHRTIYPLPRVLMA
jgi:hypothetical protein